MSSSKQTRRQLARKLYIAVTQLYCTPGPEREAARETALQTLREGATAGHPEFMMYLGDWCDEPAQAKFWWHEAACKGNSYAMHRLADLAITQDPPDWSDAQRWLKAASEHGNTSAIYEYAFNLHYGRGSTRDLMQAEYWYRQAAQHRHSWAAYQLSVLLTERALHGAAREWLKVGLSNQHPESMARFAYLYYLGHPKGLHLLQRACTMRCEVALGWLLHECEADRLELSGNFSISQLRDAWHTSRKHMADLGPEITLYLPLDKTRASLELVLPPWPAPPAPKRVHMTLDDFTT